MSTPDTPPPASSHSSRSHAAVWSLAVTLAGLAGIALLDKLLTVRLGPVAYAQWSQLQSLGELVAGIVGAGLTQGLVVLAAAGRDHALQMRWLWLSVLMGGATTLPVVAVTGVIVSAAGPAFNAPGLAAAGTWLTGTLDALSQPGWLVLLTLAGAWLGIAQMQLNALWVARGHLATAFVVALALTLVSLLAGVLAPAVDVPLWLAVTRVVIAVAVLALVWLGVRSHVASPEWRQQSRLHRGELARFLWMGVAIGLLTPLGQMLARSSVAAAHGWETVAAMQGLWRMGGWVGSLAAGLMALWLLPRWSRALGDAVDGLRAGRLLRDAAGVVVAAWLALLAAWWWQAPLASFMFDAQFVVPRPVAAGFLLGEAIRAFSWTFLFGLMATRRTWAVVVTELASLPLFALLVSVVPTTGLGGVGQLYAATYVAYASALALCFVRRGRPPAQISDRAGS